MRFIISPAKKMNETPDILEFQGYPEFIKDADILREYVAGLSYGEAKALWTWMKLLLIIFRII